MFHILQMKVIMLSLNSKLLTPPLHIYWQLFYLSIYAILNIYLLFLKSV